MSSPRARIERLLEVARRIADPEDPLGREARARLIGTTRLSAEGVELALSRHLEVHPSEEELASLVASCAAAERCFVVLSANVCTAALRALAIAWAMAPEVRVRASRRDPTLAELLVREVACPALSMVTSVEEAGAGDELHVYGSDAAIDHYRALAAPGVRVVGHGTGLGLAVVGPGADLVEAAGLLVDDVVAFDQRGCLSPRVVLVEGDAQRSLAFAHRAGDALTSRGAAVPRGALDEETRHELAMYRATVEAIGEAIVGADHLVGVDTAPRALVVPPAARAVHVVSADVASAGALLAPVIPFVTTVGLAGGGEVGDELRRSIAHARHVALGEMQRPPLDGPVDRRP